MKVTEIACIQGAWTQIPPNAKTVLDIGCGTGLLSLMIAQKYPEVKIDAIEIDEKCFRQAKENIAASSYKDRIECIHDDIKKFAPAHQYDFIITNPPFFEHQLKSPDKEKNTAWHSDDLTLRQLTECIDKLLKPEGRFSILLPVHREQDILKISSEFSFTPEKILQIRHSDKHPVTHLVFIFSRNQKESESILFSIKEDGRYTNPFIDLLKPFYLKL